MGVTASMAGLDAPLADKSLQTMTDVVLRLLLGAVLRSRPCKYERKARAQGRPE